MHLSSIYLYICLSVYLSIHPFTHTRTHVILKPTIKASGVTFKMFVEEGLKNSDLVASGVRDCAQSPPHILTQCFYFIQSICLYG